MTLTTLAGPGRAWADALDTKLEQRVQLHRNGPRGQEYVPTSSAGGSAGSTRSVRVEVSNKVNLDGDPIDNVYSSALPMDFNGNGTSEYLIWNGHKTMRLYGRAGNKVWQISNSAGRKLGPQFYIHRDQAAVLDLDGDRKEDVLHCWQSGSTKQLIARNGVTGKEIRKVSLPGQSLTNGAHCRISVYYKQSDKKAIILLAGTQSTKGACGGRNYTDNWVQVDAFDTSLKRLWTTRTCEAGHVTAGVDMNLDGFFDYVFVGKYSLDFNGRIRCMLQGWTATDHVDAIRVAKLDPKSSSPRVIAVGASGGGAFDPSNCKRIWTMPVVQPQEMVVAQLDPAPAPLSITTSTRSDTGTKVVTTLLNASGKKVRIFDKVIQPMQNAQLDGYRRNDEIVAMFGTVYDGKGNQLLSKNWYWNLKGNKVREKSSSNVYDRWVAYPFLFDMDNDGKDEMVTWGQSLIVEGKFR